MATQFIDGTFSETLPYSEALSKFEEYAEAGLAKAFFVGTQKQVEKAKDEQAMLGRLEALEAKIGGIEAKTSQIIITPTTYEIEKYT